jgi:bifunctional UDP-N-acetylglucosamine pyrophosphorylase/glucosamine-1-phosphate N-acetyltransferase
MAKRTCLAIILAAGEGTRMRSNLPKVMHPVGGLPMLGHVIAAAGAAGATRTAIVVGPEAGEVRDLVGGLAPAASVHEQAERLGTAHAVLAAQKAFSPAPDDVLVLYGDTPLVRPETLKRMRRAIANAADIVVLGFRPADPAAYGRLIVEHGRLVAIREKKDASPEELKIGFCNAGVMAFSGTLLPHLKKIGNDNASGHHYLTDLVALANRGRRTVVAIEADADEVAGVNTRRELSEVEGTFQRRAREAAMAGGVTLIAPKTVMFSFDTKIGRDVIVEPNVFFGPGVTIEAGVTVRGFSHIEGASIATGAVIGPFARLRPGSAIGAKARVGNFVETKAAVIDAGAKVNHLSYIGDAHIGAGANIGAGTITCNYDGFGKYRTEIGARAFIGSNSALVAPVTIGDGAYVASGSVITLDVPAEALAVARGRQVTKPGWVAKLRELKGGRKGHD